MDSHVALAALAALLSGCAAPAVVMVSPAYDAAQIKRVGVLPFGDFPGFPGSGSVVSDTFEKYLLWGGYSVIERREVQKLLEEQSLQASGAVDPATIRKVGRLLGVDAVAFGSVGDYESPREQTVMVDEPQEESDPVYGSITTVQHNGTTTVRTTQNVVTGYAYSRTHQVVPEVQALPAHVALSVRLVSVDSGELLWAASSSSDGVDLNTAAEQASSRIMQAMIQRLKKR